MLVRPAIAILLPAAAAASGAWSISQQLELVTNATEEGLVLDTINFGYSHWFTNHTVSVIEVGPLAGDDALAGNWSCLDSCLLWKLEFQEIVPDLGSVHPALVYTGCLAYYDDTDTPFPWQGTIGAFYDAFPDLLSFEFLNFYGATFSHFDTAGEEDAAQTHARSSARSAVAAGAAPDAWIVTQLLELVTNATEEELVLKAVRNGYRTSGFGSWLTGFNVSVVVATPVAVDDALAANWSCFDSCQHWAVEFHGIAPFYDSAHFALQYAGAFAYYDDTATPGPGQGPISGWYLGPPSDILPLDFLNFYGTTLIHLDRPMEEEAVETTSETQTFSTSTRSLTLTTTSSSTEPGPGPRTTLAESTGSEAQTITVGSRGTASTSRELRGTITGGGGQNTSRVPGEFEPSSCRPRSPPPLALALASALAAAALALGGVS